MMFGKGVAKIESFVGAQSEIEGDFTVEGTLRIDGRITGTVRAEHVILSETAVIKGDVLVKKIIVGGYVEGNISAPELVAIRSKGKVKGDVFTNNFSVTEGAQFNGRVEMRAEQSLASELAADTTTVDRAAAIAGMVRSAG